MSKPKWILVDGDRRAIESGTFAVPPLATQRQLRVGSLVKLIFELVRPVAAGPSGERMWVRVTRCTSSIPRRYFGLLESDPVIVALKWGAEVEFGLENVVDIESDRASYFDPNGKSSA